MKRVVLYSQSGCPPCTAGKGFLKNRGVEFEYRDVQADPEALRELVALQSRSTPTVVVDGEVMIGFDPERLEAMLSAV